MAEQIETVRKDVIRWECRASGSTLEMSNLRSKVEKAYNDSRSSHKQFLMIRQDGTKTIIKEETYTKFSVDFPELKEYLNKRKGL